MNERTREPLPVSLMDIILLPSRRVLRVNVRLPQCDPLQVGVDTVTRHICRFWSHFERYSAARRMAATFFRSRERRIAGYLLFKHLSYLSHSQLESNYLAEALTRLCHGECSSASLLGNRYYSASVVEVFVELCWLLQCRQLDSSRHLFDQLRKFLVRSFDDLSLATGDTDASARCLVALDGLRRNMEGVLADLASTSRTLAAVVASQPYQMDTLSKETKRELVRWLGHVKWNMPTQRYGYPLRGSFLRRPTSYGCGGMYLESAHHVPGGVQLTIKHDYSRPTFGQLSQRHNLTGFSPHELDYDSDSSDGWPTSYQRRTHRPIATAPYYERLEVWPESRMSRRSPLMLGM